MVFQFKRIDAVSLTSSLDFQTYVSQIQEMPKNTSDTQAQLVQIPRLTLSMLDKVHKFLHGTGSCEIFRGKISLGKKRNCGQMEEKKTKLGPAHCTLSATYYTLNTLAGWYHILTQNYLLVCTARGWWVGRRIVSSSPVGAMIIGGWMDTDIIIWSRRASSFEREEGRSGGLFFYVRLVKEGLLGR